MKKEIFEKLGSWRYLISKYTKLKYICKKDKDYHCKEGIIYKEDLKSVGSVESSVGRRFIVSESNFYDLVKKFKRGPQIVLEKDLGYIVGRCRLSFTSKIVEAGGGMGGATTFFANLFREVVTYEMREEFIRVIEYNLNLFGLNNVEIKNQDICEGIENEDLFDLLFLDLPNPEEVLKKKINLRIGFYVVLYLPSISQVQSVVKMVNSNDTKNQFIVEEVSEVILRNWKVTEKIAHPEHHKKTDHTAFLVFLRRIL